MSIGSYGKIYGLGHRAIRDIFNEDVVVEEKVDGSQIGFGLQTVDGETRLCVRSNGAQLNLEAPEKMFSLAIANIVATAPLLVPGWTYRGEYLQKPKHNVLTYGRVPSKHIIIWDIDRGQQDYLSPSEKVAEATRLGFETVPLLFQGKVTSEGQLQDLLETVSVLGGGKIEGVVCKNYQRFDIDKKILTAKLVAKSFKEAHKEEWAGGSSDTILARIAKKYHARPRWEKAVQHLRERGELLDSPQDIGKLMREVPVDLFAEEKEEILAMLWGWAEPHIRRKVVVGLPEWYKAKLLDKQFEGK